MTAYPAWTPASRPGIIPLHPLSFGTILGRSFTALRQNPRVLLGFALVVQTLGYLVVLGAIVAITWATFSRLDTLRPGTEEFDTVMAGSVATVIIAGFVLGLAAGALSVIVQGVVVTEVAHAAVAEKLTLGALWRQVKPVVWRLFGYSLLVILVIVGVVAALALVFVGIGVAAGPWVFLLAIPLVLAMFPLFWWLTIKLLLVPAAIILEHATIGRALSRSWQLTKGRFWSSLGIILLISMVFSFVGQVVSIPFSFVSSGITTIVAPTGDPEPSAIIGIVVTGVVTYVIALLIQSVALVVQSTATALIYIDCRMRHEGLDLDLLSYVERRDAGATDLPDPYRAHVGRTIAPRVPAYAAAPPYPPGYADPAYGAAPYAPPAYAAPAPGAPAYGAPAYGAPAFGAPAPGAPAYGAPAFGPPADPAPADPSPAETAAPPAPAEAAEPAGPADAERPPTTWTAPGAPADGTDRQSPWS